jgi:hypothetical protein
MRETMPKELPENPRKITTAFFIETIYNLFGLFEIFNFFSKYLRLKPLDNRKRMKST